ncbi:hypothetical protein FN846DRAFT_966491 [Sphaerosporella brunnea]|uniref:Aminoglycoside phosphotransferase domain-containing protein n=1 Tax=Sphaerosporella brunnea TaxID=1250544 RepID=A0A5J5EM41_9PEZI|nr:hypothetical protein FN846DRAFT_966491 [Sphaerosporella brunnea]
MDDLRDNKWWRGERRCAFESEVATHLWINGVRGLRAPVVKAFDIRADNPSGVPWICMEMLNGRPLSKIAEDREFTEEEKIHIFEEVAKLQVSSLPSLLFLSSLFFLLPLLEIGS